MASILELIKHYQHGIEKYSKDENKILKCIEKLYYLDVNVGHLQETGVGRTVNALRKEPGNVGTAARALVNKWKTMVASEETSEPEDHNHDSTNYNGQGHGKDSDDNLNQSRNGEDKSDHRTSISTKEPHHRHMNGNQRDYKRKYNSEESEPETKKSRNYNSPEKKIIPDVKIKSEPQSDSESEQSDSQSDDSDSSEASQDEKQLITKIKTEPTENHQSSSSKYSSYTHHQEIKKEPIESVSKKSHETGKNSSHHNESKHSENPSKDRSNPHRSSKDKENSSERKHRSEHKTSSSEKDRSSSSKHNSSSDKHRSSTQKHESSSEKHRNSDEKHENKLDKHRSSSQSDKDKKSSHKEKHKSKESSSSKEKHSHSDKPRDASSSSKEKSHSKSDKKHLSSSDKSKTRSDKTDNNREKEHKHKSSSSHKSSKPSSSKAKEDLPKKKSQSEDSDDGIDCGSGASFAEALGMVSPVKAKKKMQSGSKELSSPYSSFENQDLGPAALLAPTAKLAPLPLLEISALPEISPNYKPRPPPRLMPHLNVSHISDEDAMSASISSKNQRTKVYSGVKTYGKVPTLYEACVQVLQEHIEALEYTGGVPYEILKPVVDKATPDQLFTLEHYNPYLMDDTDHLWQKFCVKHFRSQKRQEMETWREMYMRCQEEQEIRLKSLTANIKMTTEAKKAPIKQTKMAYVDTVVKPPRNIARKQALHGTARVAAASPAARVASLSTTANVARAGSVRPPLSAPTSAAALSRPKKAPLMQKALQFMRGRKR